MLNRVIVIVDRTWRRLRRPPAEDVNDQGFVDPLTSGVIGVHHGDQRFFWVQ